MTVLKKYTDAEIYYSQATTNLVVLEEIVMEKYSVNKLVEWKKEKEDFKIRMVNMGKHNTLLNFYNLLIPSSKQEFRMCKSSN